MKFAYKKIAKDVQRPIIPITIRNPRTDRSVRYFTLVDSGAGLPIFRSEIAEVIGIDLAAGIRKNISGVIAGESRVYDLHQVEIEAGGNAKLTGV
jgi:hypothetical protein